MEDKAKAQIADAVVDFVEQSPITVDDAVQLFRQMSRLMLNGFSVDQIKMALRRMELNNLKEKNRFLSSQE